MCSGCHESIYDYFMRSGHAWIFNPVEDGLPPIYPFSEVPEPPEGYIWDEISYVIGGYNWKARFIDENGYIITGDEDATTQYNLANEVLGLDAQWVAYHPGEEEPHNCGACHTTGFDPRGNQDGLPGTEGSWAAPGIQCEACHGPGSLHVQNPYGARLEVDRDPEACGKCHRRGDPEGVDAKDGFIQHHEQYEELFQSKHLVVKCVQCHDPHEGVVQHRHSGEQTTRTRCENCHFNQEKHQKSELHASFAQCIDCHMPRVSKSAVGDLERFTGDIRTHMMGIDPDQIGQFSEDGTEALSQIGLDFACRHCHVEGGIAPPLTDEELTELATGYHDRQ
jgi:hypothetical protein